MTLPLMPGAFYDPPLEIADFVLVDCEIVTQALLFVTRCEHCTPAAELPFDSILDQITAKDPRITDYVMERIPRCPSCHRKITEKTLVTVV